jgi:hypothetical protein
MMGGFVASLVGTHMFIWRLVGLEPKSLTLTSAPCARDEINKNALRMVFGSVAMIVSDFGRASGM